MRLRWWLFLLILIASTLAIARPGGGHSFGGGGRSSGGSRSFSSHSSSSRGGSSGGGDGALLIMLLFRHPAVGFPLLILAIVVFVMFKRAEAQGTGWSTSSNWNGASAYVSRPIDGRKILSGLRTVGPVGGAPFDPQFSLVLFEDFLYSLFAKAHEARGGNRTDSLAAYLSAEAMTTLRSQGSPKEVKAIIVGAMHYHEVSPILPTTARVVVRVQFEANYTEVGNSEASYYAIENWRLERSPSAKSLTPKTARTFNCPNCGAALAADGKPDCAYCGKLVNTGEFNWVVARIQTISRTQRGPQLIGSTEEEGTDLPTVVQPGVEQHLAHLIAKDSAFGWQGFRDRVDLVFNEFQKAWAARDLKPVRGFFSDNLLQTQQYWVSAYKSAGLTNKTQNAAISKIELARVTSDPFFDAITVRLFASSIDLTVRDSDGSVVGGDKRHPRKYTEYWTFIRGSETRGAPRLDKNCPNCSAPLSINMAGACESCSARVTSGEFDWVLSRIEQDDTYRG